MKIFIATLILLFNDGTISTDHTSFYSNKDCIKYTHEVDSSYKKRKEMLVIDDNLVWKYKIIDKVVTYCENSNLKVVK
jgi:hypothetical protein